MNPPPKDRSWRTDLFASCEVMGHFSFLWVLATILVVLMLFSIFQRGMAKSRGQVIAYCAQDQEYAEPILRDFGTQTGLKVRAVYDSEAVKTVGLANRLLAERPHPQCDVFWGNEELRTRQLAVQGVFRETNGWAAVGYRSRRIVTTHFQALRQHWGDAQWQAWCQALAANKPLLVDGNSVVVKMVGRGEAWIGLTDSDDVAAGQHEGLPVVALPISEETLLIPNTLAVVRAAPHLGAAQRLFEYLQRPEVVRRLVVVHALEGLSASEVTTPTLRVNWEALLRDLESTTARLNKVFLR
ncbi:MAG: substrate-binding domain-containing protein [Verrucomicrobia bacterium]|nr:substrate-binding domain-containing protein [Verrucomicrobiota bacterium]